MDRHEFGQEQRGVAFGMAGALIATILVLGYAAMADRAAAPMPFSARLQGAIRLDTVVVACLVAAIANVARLRFFSRSDIAGSGGGPATESVRRAGAILQNSLEQAFLAIAVHLIVAAAFARSDALIAALVALFAIGRIAFWLGYSHGAKGRAFGFGLTFYPSVLALVASAVALMGGWAA
ncbi:MAG: MAPEG family protein [Sphingobium sp.]